MPASRQLQREVWCPSKSGRKPWFRTPSSVLGRFRLKAGRWYLVAGGPKGIRTYRVSQILRIRVLDTRFGRPEGFDLAEHWQSYLDEFDDRRFLGEVVLRLSPRVVEQLPELLEPAVARAARESAQPPDPDGRIQVVIPIESVDHAAGTLLRLGADAEVLAPTELRQRITHIVTMLATIYRAQPTRADRRTS